MTTPTPDGDLQTAIARYMSDHPGRPMDLAEIADAVHATRTQAAAMMWRIVNGEARPYPITRLGQTYVWVHDPADHDGCVQVLADTIRYITGRDPVAAAVIAATVLEHQLTTTAWMDGGRVGWSCRCGRTGNAELPAGCTNAGARRVAWREHDKEIV